MNKLFSKIAGAVVGAAAVGSTLAADMQVVQPTLSSWTGTYAGVSVGARSAGNRWRTSDVSPGFGAAFVPTGGTSGAMDSTSAKIGGYLGKNWQLAPSWVAGVEADFGWANNNKKANALPGTAGLFFGTPLVGLPAGAVKGTWDGSLRLRLGYLASPSTMIYGTGGVAWQRLELTASCSIVPGNSFCFGNPHNEAYSSTKVGWTLGGGVEHMIGGNWLARFDYRYSNFGTWTQNFFVAGGVGVGFDDRFTAHVKARTHTATVGLAYRF